MSVRLKAMTFVAIRDPTSVAGSLVLMTLIVTLAVRAKGWVKVVRRVVSNLFF